MYSLPKTIGKLIIIIALLFITIPLAVPIMFEVIVPLIYSMLENILSAIFLIGVLLMFTGIFMMKWPSLRKKIASSFKLIKFSREFGGMKGIVHPENLRSITIIGGDFSIVLRRELRNVS